jgi:hypothetical protein
MIYDSADKRFKEKVKFRWLNGTTHKEIDKTLFTSKADTESEGSCFLGFVRKSALVLITIDRPVKTSSSRDRTLAANLSRGKVFVIVEPLSAVSTKSLARELKFEQRFVEF